MVLPVLLLIFVAGMGAGLLLAERRKDAVRPVFSVVRQRVSPWLNAAPVGVLLVDQRDHIRYLNPHTRTLLHISQWCDVERRRLLEVVRYHQLERVIHQARSSGRRQRISWDLATASADPRHLDITRIDPVQADAVPADGGWVAVFLQSSRSLQVQLEQQQRWVSDVAHELKTPLTALGLVAESLNRNSEPSQHGSLNRLAREIDRLQNLVADLLELSRLEAGLSREASWLEEDVLDLLFNAWQSVCPLAEQRGIELELDARDEGHRVRCEPKMLQRALLNLLDNGLRYTPENGVITARVRSTVAWVKVEVADQGPGFSQEDLQLMFQRFYRGDPSRARSSSISGSGLGLPIVQAIIAAHGGSIQARNRNSGHGAAVALLLPALPR